MREGKQYTFWELINESSILIPQIQRDYVQYRSGKVKENLENFIQSLATSLVNGTPINLNFVYGTKEIIHESEQKDAFLPIDGQQRLTTLYLLHLYIFKKENNEDGLKALKGKLQYKTRTTTKDFISKLEECEEFKDLPSKEIKESSWYSSLWSFDPSVLSCLAVLDEIHKHLNNKEGLSESLKKQSCPITFMKLEIDGIDENELYIKMNSRGKQLTAFENLKSDLYGKIKDNSDFKAKMDGDWLGVIWELMEGKNQEQNTDIFYKELLHWIIVNRICLQTKDEALVKIFNGNDKKPSEFNLRDYLKSYNEIKEFVEDIENTMEILCSYKDLISERVFRIKFDKDEFTSQIEQYPERALLFAITKFRGEIKKFPEWFRVACNLVNNAEIDSPKDYISALDSIDKFNFGGDISEFLKTKAKEKFISLPGMKECQCEEEILKAKIIDEGGWKEAITDAEKNDYFKGEIMFALKLTGVEKPADAYGKLQKFKDNWEKIEEIFKNENSNLLNRALLTYGDYSKTMSSYSDNDYFISYYYYNDRHHDNDWRGFLREKNNLKIFKSMFEELKNSGKSFEKFACERIKAISKADLMRDGEKQELHYYLIKNEELFKYIKSYSRCWIKDGEIRLLPTSTRGKYVTYQLYIFYLELVKKGKSPVLSEGKAQTEKDFIAVGDDNFSFKSNCFYKNGNFFAKTIDDAIKQI